MPRPAKSVNVSSRNLPKSERTAREKTEQSLKGGTGKIRPFRHLSKAQKCIFKNIVEELKASGILGNLDVYILNRCAISIDRLNVLDKMANEDNAMLLDPEFLKARKEYTTDVNKCCQELCLSPQARAKIGTINISKKNEDKDPLLKVLKGG